MQLFGKFLNRCFKKKHKTPLFSRVLGLNFLTTESFYSVVVLIHNRKLQKKGTAVSFFISIFPYFLCRKNRIKGISVTMQRKGGGIMEFASDTIEERYLFSYEERAAALKRSNGVCACCGKKLTTKTMTMDHIIPISRGGTNNAENLIALCEPCNKQKGNVLYMPMGYYMAMQNRNELIQMERHVEKWFSSIKEQFDIERFPLIAPCTNVQITPYSKNRKKKNIYIPQAVFRWKIINREYYEEIEAVTGIDIREIRTKLPKVHASTNIAPDEGHYPTVALYSFRKLTTDKIIAVAAVQLVISQKHMNIWFPWCEAPNKWQGDLLFNFIYLLLDTIERIAGYEIEQYTLIGSTECSYAVKDFAKRAFQKPFLGLAFHYSTTYKGSSNKQTAEFLQVLRKEDGIKETVAEASKKFSEEQKKEDHV